MQVAATSSDPASLRKLEYYTEINKYYEAKKGDSDFDAALRKLQSDPQLNSIFMDVKANGDDALQRVKQDQQFQAMFSEKMGGVPADLQDILAKVRDEPVSIFEACLRGDLKSVTKQCQAKAPVQIYDDKGITPLGYAAAKGHVEVAKALLDAKANPFNVDLKENTALHYAAGYGHEALTKLFLDQGCEKADKNIDGQTPAEVAQLNGKTATKALVS
mmetsp:Transcript_10185/g.22954  ORF Transcript_10185/g.22954 Transcript_10185/m.22954 type:complete len:217 (-) Transcript_10185:120-770(-)